VHTLPRETLTNNYAHNTMKGLEKNALQYDQQKEIVVSTREI
jgi:hypothetical protein